jgi:hypothetical protein
MIQLWNSHGCKISKIESASPKKSMDLILEIGKLRITRLQDDKYSLDDSRDTAHLDSCELVFLISRTWLDGRRLKCWLKDSRHGVTFEYSISAKSYRIKMYGHTTYLSMGQANRVIEFLNSHGCLDVYGCKMRMLE